ncbi:MAG: 3-oxoacid CoA-transferase subunit B [SAR324 cluster bacterium]|nr:3-oxoacid CoA-transferase subunit B [SAR324 cluster bacterium]
MSTVDKEKIARRAEKEISAGQVVNLGIGIPTLILKYLTPQKPVFIHSENGILGMGRHCTGSKADRNLIDAGGGYVDVEPGASFFDSVLSFSLVRSGRLNISFLGALEISMRGDLANWIIPGKYSPGIGGGMELAQKSKRLVILTAHTSGKGEPKIIEKCTLPLTAKSCVDRIITELAVIDVIDNKLVLKEISEESSIAEVINKTGAPLEIPNQELPRF